MEIEKKNPEEPNDRKRLAYVRMRLKELREEMSTLKAERDTLIAERGPRKPRAAGKTEADEGP